MSKKAIIIIAVILVVAVGATAGALAILNAPDNVAIRAISGAFDDLLERKEIKPIIDTIDGGSITASLSSVKDEDSDTDYLEDMSFAGKLYLSKDAIMLADVDVSIGDSSFEGEAYVSENVIYIKENNFIDGAYGFNIYELAENLEDSIFAPDSDSDYALPEEVYDQLMEALEGLDENSKIRDDSTKLAKTLAKDLWKIVADCAEITSENDKIRIGGEKTSVKLTTICIDADAMEEILNAVYDYLCDSDDIVDFLEKYEGTLRPALIAYGLAIDEKDSLVDLYEDWLDDFEDSIDEMCEDLEDTYEDLTVSIATPALSSKLLKLEIEVGKETVFTLDCGAKGIKKSDLISVETGGVTFEYEVKEDTSKAYKAVLTAGYEGEDEASITIDVNRSKGKFTITSESEHEGYDYYYDDYYNYNEYTYTYSYATIISGSLKKDGSEISIGIDEYKNTYEYDYDGGPNEDTSSEYVISLDLKLVLNGNDKIPAPGKYNTIDDITEEDIEAWIESFEELDI